MTPPRFGSVPGVPKAMPLFQAQPVGEEIQKRLTFRVELAGRDDVTRILDTAVRGRQKCRTRLVDRNQSSVGLNGVGKISRLLQVGGHRVVVVRSNSCCAASLPHRRNTSWCGSLLKGSLGSRTGPPNVPPGFWKRDFDIGVPDLLLLHYSRLSLRCEGKCTASRGTDWCRSWWSPSSGRRHGNRIPHS